MPWLWIALALADDGTMLSPPDLVRVDDPAAAGALARSATGALLDAPPTADVPWRYETLAVPDGFPDHVDLDAIGAGAWHEAGFRGQGVKVAVFDIQWNQAELDPLRLGEVTTADCWGHVSCETPMETAVARYGYETGSHGVACAEVIRTLAPDVDLNLVRVNGYTTLENAVDWAIRHDVDVVSMSMSFFNDSFYDGTGPFVDLTRRLDAAGVLLVTSAGNYARNHWQGPWRDVDLDDRLDFDGDGGLDLEFGAGGGRRSLYVSWDEHAGCGVSDLDVVVTSPDGLIVGRGEARQKLGGKACSPVERVPVEVSGAGVYHLEVIGRRVGVPNLAVDVLALGATVLDGVKEGSIADPGSSPWALTIGAVRADGYLQNDAEGFSSRGPAFGGIVKPDLAGPDGLTSETYGAHGFYGTSAATPAVAAAVALVLSRYPELTPREAADRLKVWAWREDDRWDDPRWGAGKVRLPPPDVEPFGCGGGGGSAMVLPLLAVARRRRR